MRQRDVGVQLLRQFLLDQLVGVLRAGDRVPDHDRTAAVGELGAQQGDEGFVGVVAIPDRDAGGSAGRLRGDMPRGVRVFSGQRNQRIPQIIGRLRVGRLGRSGAGHPGGGRGIAFPTPAPTGATAMSPFTVGRRRNIAGGFVPVVSAVVQGVPAFAPQRPSARLIGLQVREATLLRQRGAEHDDGRFIIGQP